MKRLIAFCFSILILLSSVSCSDPVHSERLGGLKTPEGEIYPEDFLYFDGKEISFTEFRYYYLNYKAMYLQENPDHFKTEGSEEALKEEILQCLKDNWAVRFLASEKHVKLTSSEKKAVKSDIADTVNLYSGDKAFLEVLNESHMSRALYDSMMEYSALYLKLFNRFFEEGGEAEFSDEEYYAYYRENYLAVLEIFLPYEEGEDEKSCEKTLAKAADVHAKAAAGEDFWGLVQAFGKDENMLNYPDGYYFTEGEAEERLYEASRALEIGQISEPVVTTDGIYVLKRMELKTLRMDENRETALFGYYDTYDVWHPGAYDEVFHEIYRARADKIEVKFGKHWEDVSTETVF
ncbi:MAG: peptidylprolyl isomerase [Clostridia bacterium]|nr:peptidylprolyl isomerase [Clostridia bacterium]